MTARFGGPIALGGTGYVHLDALLAAAVCLRDQIPPASTPDEVKPIEIPVKREPGGRFHLASASVGGYERMERKHIVRRFPIVEAQAMLGKARINTASGPHRDFRFPLEVGHLHEDRLQWWCVGEQDEIDELLMFVTHVGRKRAVGLGRVLNWSVEGCDPWGDGFPIVAPGGTPLRHLPPDWPGTEGASVRYGRLTYPYHHLGAPEQLVVAPC